MGRLPFVDQPSTVTRGLYPQVQKQMEEEAGRKLTRADQAETARAGKFVEDGLCWNQCTCKDMARAVGVHIYSVELST